jgi:hypothetical protein
MSYPIRAQNVVIVLASMTKLTAENISREIDEE